MIVIQYTLTNYHGKWSVESKVTTLRDTHLVCSHQDSFEDAWRELQKVTSPFREKDCEQGS